MRKWAGRTTLLILTLWMASAAGRVLWAQVSPIQGIPSPAAAGSVTVTGTVTTAGNRTNNTAAPGSLLNGALSCIANAAAPTWTETFLTALSCNLAGDLRVIVSNAVALGQTTKSGSTPVTLASDQFPDPCVQGTKVFTPISQTANTQLVAGVSAKKKYICYALVVGADAENVSFVEGTGSVCATSTVAVIGGATAATGPNFAANGGTTIGVGGFSVGATTVNANNLCLFQSAGGRVAGVLVTVDQ